MGMIVIIEGLSYECWCDTVFSHTIVVLYDWVSLIRPDCYPVVSTRFVILLSMYIDLEKVRWYNRITTHSDKRNWFIKIYLGVRYTLNVINVMNMFLYKYKCGKQIFLNTMYCAITMFVHNVYMYENR